jgi:integrase
VQKIHKALENSDDVRSWQKVHLPNPLWPCLFVLDRWWDGRMLYRLCLPVTLLAGALASAAKAADISAPPAIRRRLAALSSVYKHLVRHGHPPRNPIGEVARPSINRDEGSTLAVSKAQARKLLDAPVEDTVAGLRDRALLLVGLQVGLRRAESQPLRRSRRRG